MGAPGRRGALRAARGQVAHRARGAQRKPLVAGPDGAGGGGACPPPTRRSVVRPHPRLSSGSKVWEGTVAAVAGSRRPRGGGAAARGSSWGASVVGEEARAIEVEIG